MGGGTSLLPLRNLVTRLGVRLVPLALLYVTKAVYACASPFRPTVDSFEPTLLKSLPLSCDRAARGSCRGSCCAPRSHAPSEALRLRGRPGARRSPPR